MTDIKANFDEAKQSQLAMAELLVKMGYRYIPRDEALALRGGDARKVLLSELTKEVVPAFNSYEIDRQRFDFTDTEIAHAVEKLERVEIGGDKGEIPVSKEKFLMIASATSSMTVKVSDGSAHDFVFIDYENIDNNDFAFTLEYEVDGKNTVRPDIVVFVNGIPLAVIENKKSSVTVDEAIKDLLKKQGNAYALELFLFAQLLVATNVDEFRYGTLGTPREFYTRWREKDEDKTHGYKEEDTMVRDVLARDIDEGVFKAMVADLNGARSGAHERDADVVVSEQDRGTVALFNKERFLRFIAHYVIYDGMTKKVMRYQQFFAIEKIMKRIKEVEKVATGERRKGGVVWHTQGSGKSLTMVNLAKEIIEDADIENPRIIIVTDRRDLDKQIADTFKAAGLKKKVRRVESGRELVDRIKEKDDAILTALVQKFDSAGRMQGYIEPDIDKNIFVLIDEAHRTQGGQASQRMDKVIPNACYIAFTGTPLLKDDKTIKRFGAFIDKYTIDDALDDKVILPLYYEGRILKAMQNKDAIERETERVTGDLTDEQRVELINRIQADAIQSNPQIVNDIAYDVEQHFLMNFAGSGLKAQLVAPSQYAAVRFHEYFEENGEIQTMPIISGTDDETGDTRKQYVHDYIKKLKEKYGSDFEKESIASFKENASGVQILIVVDKLLTGFDAPRNTVLYLVKELRNHNLLQAIARINRLFDNPNTDYPKEAGFVIDYSQNAQNLQLAMVLFGNVADKGEVEDALFDIDEKIGELEVSHDAVLEMFKTIKNKEDSSEYIALYDGKEKEKERAELYERINAFMKDFAEAMVYRDFANKFARMDEFAMDAKKLLAIKRTLAIKNAEAIDFSRYKDKIVRILDKYVSSEDEIKQLISPIEVSKMADVAQEELESDKAKAEAIAANINKTITENLEKDPEYFKRISEKVQEIIARMYEKKLADAEALKELLYIKSDVDERRDESLPNTLRDMNSIVGVLYRNILADFTEVGIENVDTVLSEIYKRLAGMFIVDWWMNVDIEKRIKKEVDDYLYDVLGIDDYSFSKKIQNIVYRLLRENRELL